MNLRNILITLCGCFILTACNNSYDCTTQPSENDLVFKNLATSWDEGIPLGNATVGALVWKKDSMMRFSLDRVDLWDLRPSDSIAGKNYRFAWVKEQIRKKEYLPVQQKFDWPYDRDPAPSKIPGAALEFSLAGLGTPNNVCLYLNNALCEVKWDNGASMKTFVHANKPVGWFVFHNLPTDINPVLVPPVYNDSTENEAVNSHAGADLKRLGYPQGSITKKPNQIIYHQKGWNDFYYDVAVTWEKRGTDLYGVWSVTSSLVDEQADVESEAAIARGLREDYSNHLTYWNNFWAASSISLPDKVLQKQYQNEMYKYASATREHSYPISLQAVWTADNGKLPPWKGDYHHDLNTQLSYWPTYIGNHLQEGMGYLNTLWNQRKVFKKYTKQYFETEGMNIPGVTTLLGEPMGGWIQYSMSQTAGAWLAQHFYLHWKYSDDRTFLEERAYPFLREVAVYMEQASIVDEKGVRRLEFSSSPEIFDNSLQAWFPTMTNFDLALMHFLFKATAELAGELGKNEEAAHWIALKKQLPELDIDEDGSLTFANGFPYNASHRHFSHAMAIHPLSLLDWSNGSRDQHIIRSTIQKLKAHGPDYWTGYSYAWLGNLQARAFDGEGAAQTLRTFAECFCLKNTFHVNGDQSNTGKSRFTYRPFTLEGNFAFAAGIQEMLLQSHSGVIHVFPAVPADWKEVSFEKLRAMGGILVSAKKTDGKVSEVRLFSEHEKNVTIAIPDTMTVTVPAGKWINLK